jgi:hypothetical protein
MGNSTIFFSRFCFRTVIWVEFHQHVYEQLLHAKILKVQKRQSSHQCLFALLGFARLNAARKNVGEIDPLWSFSQLIIKLEKHWKVLIF